MHPWPSCNGHTINKVKKNLTRGETGTEIDRRQADTGNEYDRPAAVFMKCGIFHSNLFLSVRLSDQMIDSVAQWASMTIYGHPACMSDIR